MAPGTRWSTHLPVSPAGLPLRGIHAAPEGPRQELSSQHPRATPTTARPAPRSDGLDLSYAAVMRWGDRPFVHRARSAVLRVLRTRTATRFPLGAQTARPPLGISRSVCSCNGASPTRRRSGGQQSICAEKRSPETANGQPMVTALGDTRDSNGRRPTAVHVGAVSPTSRRRCANAAPTPRSPTPRRREPGWRRRRRSSTPRRGGAGGQQEPERLPVLGSENNGPLVECGVDPRDLGADALVVLPEPGRLQGD